MREEGKEERWNESLPPPSNRYSSFSPKGARKGADDFFSDDEEEPAKVEVKKVEKKEKKEKRSKVSSAGRGK